MWGSLSTDLVELILDGSISYLLKSFKHISKFLYLPLCLEIARENWIYLYKVFAIYD